MFAILFIVLSVVPGWAAVDFFIPAVRSPRLPEKIPAVWVRFPAYFSVGMIFSAWLAYFLSYGLSFTGNGTRYGAAATLILLSVFAAVYIFVTQKNKKTAVPSFLQSVRQSAAGNKAAVFLFAAVALYAAWLMSFTFHIQDGSLFMGYAVFSDMGPHVSMVKSFVSGNNFPTQYPYFPDGTVRYHFMYQFLIAVLETLGLRMDAAFNLMSALSIVCLCMLLYALACKLTGRRGAGLLSVVLMFFRPATAWFAHIAENKPLGGWGAFFKFAAGTSTFIGKTQHDDWGLWATNDVFANQRHLPFALIVLLLVLTVMFPLTEDFLGGRIPPDEAALSAERSRSQKAFSFFRKRFLSLDAWLPLNIKTPLFLGLLTGALGFFNGAVTIALLSMLFVLAVFSKRRLAFLSIALIAAALVLFEGSFFAGNAELVSVSFPFGFLADDKTVPGALAYVFALTGALLFLSAFTVIAKPQKWLIPVLVFAAPTVIAFTVSLTPDIAVNHKYVMISIFLLNIPAAYALTVLFTQKNRLRWPGRAAALALAFALTATGVFDHFAMYHKNKEGQRYQVELNGRTEEWIATNTEPGDVFASHIHWMSPVFLAGRFAFMGWPYYPWSAGYDTLAREDALKKFFAAEDGRVLQTLARLYRVSYVLADGALRESADFEFNEALFDETFEVVFYDEETDIKIYRVQNLRS